MKTSAGTLTFSRGGVHPPENKDRTSALPIEVAPLPQRVQVLMVQHIGAPSAPVVKRKDKVKKGQIVGEARGYVSANVHSPVSGTIVKVDSVVHNPTGRKVPAVTIENDGDEEWAEGLNEPQDTGSADSDRMIELVQEAGVVGLGGAAFPSHVKLKPPPHSPVSDVFINGAECEPYITCDHRLMIEKTGEVLDALRLIMRIVGASNGFIAIESNKPDAIQKFRDATEGDDAISVQPLVVKYPQGAEQQLITAVTAREVPDRGGLPCDVGCLVHNVATALAIRDAVRFRRPLIERVVTVTGDGIERAGNFLERIGTSVNDILQRQGVREDVTRLLMGGPMMGIAQGSADVPLLKGNNAILLLTGGAPPPQRACIRCGRCVEHCPLGLVPSDLSIACEAHKWDAALKVGVLECKECGCCSYVCPARRRIVHMIKFAKAELAKRKRK